MTMTSIENFKLIDPTRQKQHTYSMPQTSINKSSNPKPIISLQSIATVDNLSEHATTTQKGQST